MPLYRILVLFLCHSYVFPPLFYMEHFPTMWTLVLARTTAITQRQPRDGDDRSPSDRMKRLDAFETKK